jgi:hypothetical protein
MLPDIGIGRGRRLKIKVTCPDSEALLDRFASFDRVTERGQASYHLGPERSKPLVLIQTLTSQHDFERGKRKTRGRAGDLGFP